MPLKNRKLRLSLHANISNMLAHSGNNFRRKKGFHDKKLSVTEVDLSKQISKKKLEFVTVNYKRFEPRSS